MDYTVVFAFTMLAVGLALIVAELFIPSGGVISLLSVICLGVSIYRAHDAWFDEYPNWFWWYLGSVLGLIPATLGGALYLLSRTRIGSRVFLEAPNLKDVTPYSDELEERKLLIGKIGKSITLMAPGGLVIVEGKRLHAETEGQMLDPEQAVKIIAVKGNRVVVRPYESQPNEGGTGDSGKNRPFAENAEPPRGTATVSESGKAPTEVGQVPLDFEIPES